MATKSNTPSDVEELEKRFNDVKEYAATLNIDLRWIEIKGTVYWFPLLEAK